MERDFWLKIWEENEIGFHQDDYNRLMLKYWSSLGLEKGSEVFVPFCGKSKDMLWLKQMGHSVLGNEISELAVNSFFQENNLPLEKSVIDPFSMSSSDHLQILVGDYFSLNTSHTKQVRAVLDRASLIALPPKMRKRYVNHLHYLLPKKCTILLITLEYEQNLIEPPPFSVPTKEIHDLYGPWCNITHLEAVPLLIKEKEGHEHVYRIDVKSSSS